MPAVEVQDIPEVKGIDPAGQRALFKLWLLLTTHKIIVNKDTTICHTKAEVDQFKLSQEQKPEDVHYVDLEKLGPGLAPLSAKNIQDVFDLLNYPQWRDLLSAVANEFCQQGYDLLAYPVKIGCVTVDSILSIPGYSEGVQSAK